MIPRPFIAKWKNNVPWRSNAQVEQDLLISRAWWRFFQMIF